MSETKVRSGMAGQENDLPFEAAYSRNLSEINILMGQFHLRYLGRLYREFDGDLALVIVLGEVAHHNISRCYSGQGSGFRVDKSRSKESDFWETLYPCNAFSLSAATGIPRETVRRKIESLVAKGWLRRNKKGEVFLTPAVPQHFNADFDRRNLIEFLELGRRILPMFSGVASPGAMETKPPAPTPGKVRKGLP